MLPFFHSYGYTTTLWTPLVLDPAVIYHADPRDAQVVGRLAREYHATNLMATPTFLRIYVRRTPAEDFSTLEAVFGAAEKLPQEASQPANQPASQQASQPADQPASQLASRPAG